MPNPQLASPHPAKGPLFVRRRGEAASHWMPDDGGWTETIISPAEFPMLNYAMGIQQLAPGETVPEHYHDRHEELFYVYEGRGRATLDGQEFEVGAGDTLFFGRNISHTLTNTGDGPMSWVWIFNPPGLEFVLAGVGTPRSPGQQRPAHVPRPEVLDPLVRVVTKRGRPSLPGA